MKESVYEGWIRSLSEREFDEPFMALLRANGFTDIHYTHGAYEFGKDFVAKREETGSLTQYAFQLKAGDIDGGAWNQMVGQLHELTGRLLTQPNYDSSLPCTFVLVLTGALKGKAILSAKDFGQNLKETRQQDFEVWDCSNIEDLLDTADPWRISSVISRELTLLLARTERGPFSDRDLERWLQTLVPPSEGTETQFNKALLMNGLLASNLVRLQRPFHALACALNGIRIAATRSHGSAIPQKLSAANLEMTWRYYKTLGSHSLAGFISAVKDVHDFVGLCGDLISCFVVYPIACARVMEYLGLSSLFCHQVGAAPEAVGLAQRCAELVHNQPGCCHPISDREASSIAPAVIAMSLAGLAEDVRYLLRRTTVWICDTAEGPGAGLAGVYSTPSDQVQRLLARAFGSGHIDKRRDSLVAAVLLDLSYVFAPELYGDIANDLAAVGLEPRTLYPEDRSEAYLVGKRAVRSLINIRYPESHNGGVLEHHALKLEPRIPERHFGPVTMLALSCLTRDRLFSDCYRRFLSFEAPQRGPLR